ncbi:hypothetical protein niasHT_024853 [Heterodera trifolii]|uniref:Uncharacterized protein n=1 Tax=Heterodera trifolii TaxID=157864 RepID=A0ABD2JG61_9BILA
MGKRTGGAPRGPKIVAGACASPERKKRQTKHYNKLNRANITVSNSAPNVPTIIRTLEGERSYRVKAVLASLLIRTGKQRISSTGARGQECWIPSESCDCLEMAIDFTKKANVHDVLRGLLGEPIADAVGQLGEFIKNCLEAAPAPEQSDSEDE